ncbi:MAG: alpha/beta hydrolase, partial [Acidobacteriota bacterium]
RDLAALPATLARFERGEWAELAATALEIRRLEVHALALAMDCASGASPERWRRLAAETADPANLLGDALLAPYYPSTCRGAGFALPGAPGGRQPRGPSRPGLGDSFRGPLASPVPVLLTSGTLDARTPPENALELLPGLGNAVHVIVENAGHPSRELMSAEYRDLVQAFLRGERLESTRIALPEPIFETARPGGEADGNP